MSSFSLGFIEFVSGVFHSSIECMPGQGCKVEWDTVAALASLLVGFFAWLTARRSSKIAEKAVEIAARQHREMEIQRVNAGEVLGHLLVVEIGALPTEVARRRDMVRALIATAQVNPGAAPAVRAKLTRELRSMFREDAMKSTEQSLARIHNLPDYLAQKLARLLGFNRLTHSAADAILQRCEDDKDFDVVIYQRGMGDWEQLDSMLTNVFRESVDCACALRKFVGFSPVTYDDAGSIAGAQDSNR